MEAGRKFVETDVTYMHDVEGVHTAIMSASGHQHAVAAEGEAEHKEHGE